MNWNIQFHEAAAQYVEKLSKEKLKSLSKEIALLRLSGNELRLPHSKSLGKGLFELREREFGIRRANAFNGKMVIIVLAGGDKSSQERDIKTARKRLGELK